MPMHLGPASAALAAHHRLGILSYTCTLCKRRIPTHIPPPPFLLPACTQPLSLSPACAQLDKQHLEGMEVYSTVLWHLKRDTALSHLAQELVAIDRMAPQVGVLLTASCSAAGLCDDG